MIPADQLIKTYQSNLWLARRTLEGLTQAESLLQPPFKANNLNWIVGHLVSGRQRALQTLGHPGVWSTAEHTLYNTGSMPISSANALALDLLTGYLVLAQDTLDDILPTCKAEFLTEAIATPFGEQPRWQYLSGLAWHETFHVGQLDMLRAMILDSRSIS